jgi:hypothetical protein
MRRRWPGEIVWYRMWGIGVLAVPVLLVFVDWFAAIFLAVCVMGAYAVLVSLIYDGEWSRDAEGDKVWLPKESRSGEPPGPPHAAEERGTPIHSIGNTLFPLIVITVLVYIAIQTLVVK